MPPRKKVKLSPAAASTVSKSTIEDKGSPLKNETFHIEPEPDLWTDEQYISLFKGMIRWKPVGMHKHFRMLALSQYMRSHGHDPTRDPHTSIPGIWKKLHTLYNLEALDEREDSLGDEDGDVDRELWEPFELPEEEFEDRMHAKRINPTASSSPPSLSQLWNEGELAKRRASRPSTVDDSEDPRSSPASARGAKPKKGGRGGRSTRKSRLKEQLSPEAGSEATTKVEEKDEGEDGEEDEEEGNASEDVGTPSSVARKGKQTASARGGARGARGRFKKRGGRKR